MTISNDPQWVEGVVTQPFTDTVEWVFDDRRVVWVQLEDAVGKRSEPYPAEAPDQPTFAAAAAASARVRDAALEPAGSSRLTPRWLPFLWRDER